jgi:hypothetical protein
VKLFNQAKAGLEQQTAIAGTLKVPSRASFDREQLLRTLVNHATRLCEASHGFVFPAR